MGVITPALLLLLLFAEGGAAVEERLNCVAEGSLTSGAGSDTAAGAGRGEAGFEWPTRACCTAAQFTIRNSTVYALRLLISTSPFISAAERNKVGPKTMPKLFGDIIFTSLRSATARSSGNNTKIVLRQGGGRPFNNSTYLQEMLTNPNNKKKKELT
jgi:hypothetical protein